jgi:hypothetical protein
MLQEFQQVAVEGDTTTSDKNGFRSRDWAWSSNSSCCNSSIMGLVCQRLEFCIVNTRDT